MPKYLVPVLEQVTVERVYVVEAPDEQAAFGAFDHTPKVVRLVAPPYKTTGRKATVFVPDTSVSAMDIANAIRPGPKQYARKVLLRALLVGTHDSSLSRAGMIGLSKSLKTVFPNSDKPIECLVLKNRVYNSDGSYRGLVYRATPLSEAVYEIMKEDLE